MDDDDKESLSRCSREIGKFIENGLDNDHYNQDHVLATLNALLVEFFMCKGVGLKDTIDHLVKATVIAYEHIEKHEAQNELNEKIDEMVKTYKSTRFR